jgi:UDP-glucose 4-epimerase
MSSVIQFFGLKVVGGPEAQPLKYYDNNASGSVVLFEEMAWAGVQTVVFSSSATVYGDPGYEQYREDTPLASINVYGRSKLIVENILQDIKKSQQSRRKGLLRYFNPVGEHVPGMIGEDPSGVPNNLMPFIAQAAIGMQQKQSVFGGDYPTPDGTGRRAYIHVEDLAAGHMAALNQLINGDNNSLITVNLGTGRPYSVLEMARASEGASGKLVRFKLVT